MTDQESNDEDDDEFLPTRPESEDESAEPLPERQSEAKDRDADLPDTAEVSPETSRSEPIRTEIQLQGESLDATAVDEDETGTADEDGSTAVDGDDDAAASPSGAGHTDEADRQPAAGPGSNDDGSLTDRQSREDAGERTSKSSRSASTGDTSTETPDTAAAESDERGEATAGGRGTATQPLDERFANLGVESSRSTEEIDDAGPTLPPRELDRAFSILDEAITSDGLGGTQLNRLLDVFEQAFVQSGQTDPEAMAELISMLEELVIEPEDLAEVDLDGFLAIFEEAIGGATNANQEDLADIFDVIEEGIRDPTRIDPDDVERFRTGVENAILDITDPNSGSMTNLFGFAEMLGQNPERTVEGDPEQIDMFRIARIGAGLTQRATGYSMESGIRTGTRMAYAAANSESPARLLTNTRAIALDELQRAGIDIGQEQQAWLESHEDELIHPRPVTREALEERGEQLLRESAEIGLDESIHPSFPVVLDQLATDEARILRLLSTEGPQGVVDVYARKFIPFTLKPIARDQTMLGADAGCRTKARTPLYVQNLRRLGLVEIRDEPVENLKRYQVLEAQPHVEAARDSVKRPKTKYKRIQLTDFGVEFCDLCFPFSVKAQGETCGFREDVDT